MPRIEAKNIETHVRIQTGRILDAASNLFNARGYRSTDLGDIAAEIGLARNSLYRYYRNKDHILFACLERDMAPIIEQTQALENIKNPRERVDAWLAIQMEIAQTRCHSAMQTVEEVGTNSPELRKKIAELHAPSAEVLRNALNQILRKNNDDPELMMGMIVSMVRSAARRAMETGKQNQMSLQLRKAVRRMLSSR